MIGNFSNVKSINEGIEEIKKNIKEVEETLKQLKDESEPDYDEIYELEELKEEWKLQLKLHKIMKDKHFGKEG